VRMPAAGAGAKGLGESRSDDCAYTDDPGPRGALQIGC
jgi:hypothetical protein